MPRCLSFTVARDRCYRRAFLSAGLRPSSTALADGATVHCWVPARPDPSRPPLLLLHGFGATAIWQWSAYLRPLLRAGFDLYVPDLLFFGASKALGPDRSESYQASCIAAAMEAAGVRRFGLMGVSYGGFVAYRMAAMYPAAVERVVLCCAGVCLEERDLASGLFVVSDMGEAIEILLPQRPEKLRQLVRLSFVRPPPVMPSCFLWDYIQVMCTNYVREKTELIHALINDRKLSDLPMITQPTLIIWGEQDQIFPLELGYRLKRHLGDNARLVVISNAGHAVNLEKSKELCRHIIAFFLDSPLKNHNGQMCCGTRWKIFYNFAGLTLRRLASKFQGVPKKAWITSVDV
ncbi:uncharacterized protein LOC135650878 isoform X1 [Musa acuminata AAA Group]|uniref:uncharacterized protein LOC135650878 isoform X1 n=1 Tax=Musa acuminata AAA Group TaxID=214697 RepID=UPI0031DB73E5